MKNWRLFALSGSGLEIDQTMIEALQITNDEVAGLDAVLMKNYNDVLALEKSGARQFTDKDGNLAVEITPDRDAMKLVKGNLSEEIVNILGSSRAALFQEGLRTEERMLGDGVLNADPRVVTIRVEIDDAKNSRIMVNEVNKTTGRGGTRQMSLAYWKLRYAGVLPFPK